MRNPYGWICSAEERAKAVPLRLKNGCDVIFFSTATWMKICSTCLMVIKWTFQKRLEEAVNVFATKSGNEVATEKSRRNFSSGIGSVGHLKMRSMIHGQKNVQIRGNFGKRYTENLLPLNPEKHKRAYYLRLWEISCQTKE